MSGFKFQQRKWDTKQSRQRSEEEPKAYLFWAFVDDRMLYSHLALLTYFCSTFLRNSLSISILSICGSFESEYFLFTFFLFIFSLWELIDTSLRNEIKIELIVYLTLMGENVNRK